MAKLIGHITYPEEKGLSVEYAKLYHENNETLLEFRLVNHSNKTVNAYRADISYSVNGEEKTESVQGKNLELSEKSATDVITVILPKTVEEGSITLAAVIYDDLSHNESTLSFPFATFDTISRVAETVLSGATPVASTKANAKESLLTIARGESTAPVPEAPPSPKRSALPLILALSALGGMILTVILQVLSAYFVYQKIGAGILTLGEASAVISLLFFTLFTGCAALALTAILLHKKNLNQSVAVILLSILSLIAYLYFALMFRVGIFLLVAIALGIVFFILSLVKKNTALLVTAISMILIIFLLIGLFGGCNIGSCGGKNNAPPDNNNMGVGNDTTAATPVAEMQMELEFVSNGDGTCYVSGCYWHGGTNMPASPYLDNGSGILTIPEYSPNGDRVVAIGEQAFYDEESIYALILAPSVKTIQAEAFGEISHLQSVNLGSVEIIGNSAFIDCNNLETVTGLDSLSDLQAHAFYSCRALQSISLSGALRTIGEYALSGTGLTSVTVPYNVTSMGEGIFENCYSLVSAAIDCSVSYLPANTFRECSSLETVSLPYGMIEIGESAFEHSALAHITLPETIERIETHAFFQCQELERVFIPYATTSISNSAFYECSSLHTVYWGRTEGELGYVSIGNSNQDLRDAPNQYFGFYNVYFSENDDGTYTLNAAYPDNRTEFVIPDTAPNGKKITVISNRCFKDNQQLQTITIPLSVTKIDFEAFDGCVGLKKIIYEGSEESWNQIDIAYGNEKLRTAEIEFLNIAYEQ